MIPASILSLLSNCYGIRISRLTACSCKVLADILPIENRAACCLLIANFWVFCSSARNPYFHRRQSEDTALIAWLCIADNFVKYTSRSRDRSRRVDLPLKGQQLWTILKHCVDKAVSGARGCCRSSIASNWGISFDGEYWWYGRGWEGGEDREEKRQRQRFVRNRRLPCLSLNGNGCLSPLKNESKLLAFHKHSSYTTSPVGTRGTCIIWTSKRMRTDALGIHPHQEYMYISDPSSARFLCNSVHPMTSKDQFHCTRLYPCLLGFGQFCPFFFSIFCFEHCSKKRKILLKIQLVEGNSAKFLLVEENSA